MLLGLVAEVDPVVVVPPEDDELEEVLDRQTLISYFTLRHIFGKSTYDP